MNCPGFSLERNHCIYREYCRKIVGTFASGKGTAIYTTFTGRGVCSTYQTRDAITNPKTPAKGDIIPPEAPTGIMAFNKSFSRRMERGKLREEMLKVYKRNLKES